MPKLIVNQMGRNPAPSTGTGFAEPQRHTAVVVAALCGKSLKKMYEWGCLQSDRGSDFRLCLLLKIFG